MAAGVAFEIAAGDAATTLKEFAAQAHLQLLFDYKAVQFLKTPAVKGQLEPSEALKMLLRGTGLTFRQVNDRTIAVMALGSDSTTSGSPSSQPSSPTPGGSPNEDKKGFPNGFRMAQADPGSNSPSASVQGNSSNSQDSTKRPAQLEEVIVTAQKREENLQTVPIAITTFSGADLEQRGITSFDGIAHAIPSISFTPYPSSSDTFVMYMRGQGTDDPGQITRDSAVGLYEDGFYISRPQASTFDLTDIDRVEVLQGPQGTLYGRNTTGGAVNLISKQPTGEFGVQESLDFGNRDMYRSLTVVDLPQWEDLSAKVTVLKSGIDGYVNNLDGVSHDFGLQNQTAGRLQLRYQPSQSFHAEYFFERSELDSTPLYWQNPLLNGQFLFNATTPYYAANGPMSTTYRPIDLPLSTARANGQGLTITGEISPALTVKSLTGYRTLDNDNYQDYAEVFSTPYATQDQYSDHQFSEELQALGTLAGNDVRYVIGVYYFREGGWHYHLTNLAAYDLAETTLTGSETTSKAAYAQLSWTPELPGRHLELTAGGRYTQDDKSAERFSTDISGGVGQVLEDGAASGAANAASYNRFNPAFIVSYAWTDDVNSYAKVATGYKAGGSNELQPIGEFNHTFGPESITTYELGLKSYWLEHRLRANGDVFYSKYRDIQLLVQADPDNPAVYDAYNAGRATIAGVEFEVVYAPIEDLSVTLNYAYLYTKDNLVTVAAGTVLDPAVNPASPYHVGENVSDLFTIPYAAKNSLDASADYTVARWAADNLSLHLDYRWKDRYFFDPYDGPGVPGAEQYDSMPSFGLLDGRLTLSHQLADGHQFRVALWSQNLLDKKYYAFTLENGGFIAIQSPTFGTYTPAGYTSRNIAWAAPRTFGIQLQYAF
jgi:iron complex outermembrane receptor protein